MSDVPKVHTAEPLVPISDEQIIYRAKLDHWTMTDALFWLSGHRSPGYESDRHMQDHFWDAYMLAVHAIEAGKLCRKIERAGKTIFTDSPKNWLAWADRIGPEYIKVDERIRRALSQTAELGERGEAPRPTNPTQGVGSPEKYKKGLMVIKVLLQEFLDENGANWLEDQTIVKLESLVREALPSLQKAGRFPKSTQMRKFIKEWRTTANPTPRAAKNDQSPLSR